MTSDKKGKAQEDALDQERRRQQRRRLLELEQLEQLELVEQRRLLGQNREAAFLRKTLVDIVHERVIFMGPGRGGKSSLTQSLQDQPFRETASTVGIDLSKLTCLVQKSDFGTYTLKAINVKLHQKMLASFALAAAESTAGKLEPAGASGGEDTVRSLPGKLDDTQLTAALEYALLSFFGTLGSIDNIGDSVFIDFVDMAGQSPFQALHDLLFSPQRTAYCVVFDASHGLDKPYRDVFTRKDGRDVVIDAGRQAQTYFTVIEAWLYTAWEAVAGNEDASIYLVGTHSDKLSESELEQIKRRLGKRIRGKKYERSLQCILFVNNTRSGSRFADRGVMKLRKLLIDHIMTSRAREAVPIHWMLFPTVLNAAVEATSEPIMPHDKVAGIARLACNDADVNASKLLNFYQSLGSVIQFDDCGAATSGCAIDPTTSMVVVDMQWLMDAAAALLSPPPPADERERKFFRHYRMMESGFLYESLAIHHWNQSKATATLAQSEHKRNSLFALLASKGVIHDPEKEDTLDGEHPPSRIFYVPAIVTCPSTASQNPGSAPLFIVPVSKTRTISHAQFSRIVVRCLQCFKPTVEHTVLGERVTMLCDGKFRLSLSYHPTAVRLWLDSDDKKKAGQHCGAMYDFMKGTLEELDSTYGHRPTHLHLPAACRCRDDEECGDHKCRQCHAVQCQHFVKVAGGSGHMHCGVEVAMISRSAWQQWIQHLYPSRAQEDVCIPVGENCEVTEQMRAESVQTSSDPWLDRRFKAHYPRLIERLQPLETRTHAFAKGIITMVVKRDLMSIEKPSEHNELFFDEIMRGGAESFQGFLDVLGELGCNFVDVREELQRLLPGRAAATSSTGTAGTYVAVAGRVGSDAATGGMEHSVATPPWSVSSVHQPVSQSLQKVQFLRTEHRTDRGMRLEDMVSQDIFMREMNRILSAEERGQLARLVVEKVRGTAEGFEKFVTDSIGMRVLLKADHRDPDAIFTFWMRESKPCTQDLFDAVQVISPNSVQQVKDIFSSFDDV